MAVVTVKVSNEERTLKEKHLMDDRIELYKDDPELKGFVEQAVNHFDGPVDDVTVVINICW